MPQELSRRGAAVHYVWACGRVRGPGEQARAWDGSQVVRSLALRGPDRWIHQWQHDGGP